MTKVEFWLIKNYADARWLSSETDEEWVLFADVTGSEIETATRYQYEHLESVYNGYREIAACFNGMLVHPGAQEMSIEQEQAFVLQKARRVIPNAFPA